MASHRKRQSVLSITNLCSFVNRRLELLGEEVHSLHVAVLGGQVQRRALQLVLDVGAGVSLVQELDEWLVAIDGGQVERSLTIGLSKPLLQPFIGF